MQTHVARRLVMVAMLSLVVGACGGAESGSEGERGVRFRLSGEATAEDVGLPAYPGSKPYQDADDSSSAANLGISTRLFGFKVIAMNLETTDTPQRVAAFYRQALAKYGNVLDCSDARGGNRKSQSSDELVCDPDEPGSHSIVYKVGTEENQRIVAIKPHGNGTRFNLVHLDVRGEAKQ